MDKIRFMNMCIASLVRSLTCQFIGLINILKIQLSEAIASSGVKGVRRSYRSLWLLRS